LNLNPLIAIPSPRDLPEIIRSLDTITKYDKLWIKYSPEHITYPIMRDKFLNHPSQHYTHLVIWPDDLLIDDKSKLEMLLEDSEKLGEKAIVCGYCNVDTSENAKYANVTEYNVSTIRHQRSYKWFTLEELKQKSLQQNPLLKTPFAGFPLMVIPRAAIEQVEFRNDSFTGKFDENGCCVDVMFCSDALKKGFEIYVDTRVRLQHLKQNDEATSTLLQKMPRGPNDYHHYFEYSDEIKVVG
jgi:hypothetical protein